MLQKAASLSVLPTGEKTRGRRNAESWEIAVVGEHPVSSPQLPDERMAVFERDLPLGGPPDMRDDVAALDGIAPHEVGDRGVAGRCRIEEGTNTGTLEERDPPAVAVAVGTPSPRPEPLEREAYVRGDVGVHAQELAHGPLSLPRRHDQTALPVRGKLGAVRAPGTELVVLATLTNPAVEASAPEGSYRGVGFGPFTARVALRHSTTRIF
jgi:hypothetical protein